MDNSAVTRTPERPGRARRGLLEVLPLLCAPCSRFLCEKPEPGHSKVQEGKLGGLQQHPIRPGLECAGTRATRRRPHLTILCDALKALNTFSPTKDVYADALTCTVGAQLQWDCVALGAEHWAEALPGISSIKAWSACRPPLHLHNSSRTCLL